MVSVETEGGGTLAKHHHPPAQRADVSRKLGEKRACLEEADELHTIQETLQ